MTTGEHELQSGQEQSAKQKLEKVRGGLVAAAQTQAHIDQLQAVVEVEKDEVSNLTASMREKARQIDALGKERQSLVDMTLLKELVEEDPTLIEGTEVIQHVMAIYAAREGRSRKMSTQEIIHCFEFAKKGQEIGVFSDGPVAFGTLTEDAGIIIDDRPRAYDGPLLFQLKIGMNEEDESARTIKVAPEYLVFGRDAMIDKYLEYVYDAESGKYYFEDRFRDERTQHVNCLFSAANYNALGLQDERVAAYHEKLLNSTLERMDKLTNREEYGDQSELLSLLEAYRTTASDQEFDAVYSNLIMEGFEHGDHMPRHVFENYLSMMEKLTARIQHPEQKHLSELDLAHARVAVLEAIQAEHARWLNSIED